MNQIAIDTGIGASARQRIAAGPRFRDLHAAFEEQYAELAIAVDGIAERMGVHAKTAWMLRSML